MESTLLPHNEEVRLAALQALDILDTAPEEEFDALVRVASLICGVPISLISLVDAERQWFKANIGLPDVSETRRDIAFCAHAILGSELFEITDATQDPRFADNPMVTGNPYMRFYAGAPIVLNDGNCVGTLCVIDRKPKQLDDQQREILRCLARAAAASLEGRRAERLYKRVVRDLKFSQERMRSLYDSTPALMHSIDHDGNLLTISDTLLAKLGYKREEVLGHSTLDFLTPASRDYAMKVVLPSLREKGEYKSIEYQMVAKDGRIFDILLSGVIERDARGQFERV